MSKTILVIEDSAPALRLVERLLASKGYTVIPKTSGSDGLDVARNQAVDLILCDIMMPQMDGYDVLNTLRKEAIVPNIPFVFLTALSDMQSVRRGMRMGPDDYVPKPINDDDLSATIEMVLERREILRQLPKTGRLNYDVFISYCREDKALMEQLETALVKNHLRV